MTSSVNSTISLNISENKEKNNNERTHFSLSCDLQEIWTMQIPVEFMTCGIFQICCTSGCVQASTFLFFNTL